MPTGKPEPRLYGYCMFVCGFGQAGSQFMLVWVSSNKLRLLYNYERGSFRGDDNAIVVNRARAASSGAEPGVSEDDIQLTPSTHGM